MAPGDLHHGIRLTGHAGIVHDDDRLGTRRDRSLDQAFIDVQGITPNIDEYRDCPAQHDGVGRRHEGERRHYDLVPRAEVAEQGRHLQARGAGMRQQPAPHPDLLLEPGAAALAEHAVTRDMELVQRLLDISELVARDGRAIETDCHDLRQPATGDSLKSASSVIKHRPADSSLLRVFHYISSRRRSNLTTTFVAIVFVIFRIALPFETPWDNIVNSPA